MNDPRKMRKIVYVPFAFSMVLILVEFAKLLLVPGDGARPGLPRLLLLQRDVQHGVLERPEAL